MNDPGARAAIGFDLGDVLEALRRRPLWLLAGLGVGLVVGLAAYGLVPPTYRSEATVLVESRWFPQDFFQNPLGKSMRDRLQTLQHRLTSDRALAEIAEEVGSERFGEGSDPAGRTAALRAGFHFEIEEAASPDAAVVRIAFSASDPELARDVVRALGRYAVEERRQEGARQAAATAEVLGTELEQLRAGLAEKSVRLAELAARAPVGTTLAADTAQERRSERLAELESLQTLEDEVRRAEARYTPRHPHLIQLRAELRRKRAGLAAPRPTASRDADDEPSAEYRALLREYESGLQTYESLLARRIDATMAEQLERAGANAEIQVLREAMLPRRPVSPDPLLFLGGGAAAGLALAALLAVLPALRRPVFSGVDPLGDTSGLPVVAAIPALPAPGPLRGPGPDPRLVVVAQPDSTAAEQYRHVLPYLSRTPGTPVVLVTSAERGAGKSVCAANLAASAAGDAQRRTLLVDADLRQPTLAPLFGVPAGAGLAECVRGEASLATAARPTSVPNLYLLQAGDAGGNPVAIFEDERLLKLLDAARREFGAIIVDAPPRLPVVDAALLERVATMVLFVVRADSTARASVQRALRGVQLPVGLILNGVHRQAYRRHFGSDPAEPPYRRTRSPR